MTLEHVRDGPCRDDEAAIGRDGYAMATLNILEDLSDEKARLELTQRAMMNLLDDFDAEKNKVVAANAHLRREVAERLQAEEALTRTACELARSNAELEQFAHVLSHDLQEPLRMISSYVQLLAKRYGGQIDAQADKYIHYTVEGVRRMEALMQGLLEYSRLSRREIQRMTVEAESALQQALSNLKRSIDDAGATVTHGRLPEVNADLPQLVQVSEPRRQRDQVPSRGRSTSRPRVGGASGRSV
jgi:signal transduction histidine kinase